MQSLHNTEAGQLLTMSLRQLIMTKTLIKKLKKNISRVSFPLHQKHLR